VAVQVRTHSSHDYLQELGVKKAATKYSATEKPCPFLQSTHFTPILSMPTQILSVPRKHRLSPSRSQQRPGCTHAATLLPPRKQSTHIDRFNQTIQPSQPARLHGVHCHANRPLRPTGYGLRKYTICCTTPVVAKHCTRARCCWPFDTHVFVQTRPTLLPNPRTSTPPRTARRLLGRRREGSLCVQAVLGDGHALTHLKGRATFEH
jgi:hypothetical protein